MSFDFKCAQFAVNDNCKNVTLDFTYPLNAISTFVSDAVFSATFMLTLVCQTAAKDMSVNQAKGVNAFRCAAVSMLNNIMNPVLGTYYLLLQFGGQKLIKEYVVDRFYPNVCTCKYEINEFGKYIMGGASTSSTNAKYIGQCSEAISGY